MLTPRQLFRLLDSGGITREEFREQMAHHARQIIVEMEEMRANPFATWVETIRNKRAAKRLVHQHSEPLLREVLVALSEVPEFPLANWLWNADRMQVPLHCFIRSTFEPVFRVLRMSSAPFMVTILVEHGLAKRGQGTREKFTLGRDRFGRMTVQEREMMK